jgi:alpha-beta hydrolase superfamily lysophospholipase
MNVTLPLHLLRRVGWVALWVAIAVSAIVLGRALDARSQPDLGPWHRLDLTAEVQAGDLGGDITWATYRRDEAALFAELQAKLAQANTAGGYRYERGSRLGVHGGDIDWNRSYESVPTGPIRGGVLLLHGLSDSPYSLRHVAALYEKQGYVVVLPRLPGHGTVPAGLLDVQWQDWLAVVELAAREVRARTGPGKPFHVVGYSNGGALALKYAMDVASGDDATTPRPDRLVLISPMIGLGRMAAVSRLLPAFGSLPYFEHSLWLDVQPEFNPYKYNSFPVNAAVQSYLLTTLVKAEVLELKARGRLSRLPPILGFQSVLDNTVSTADVVHSLYDQLPANGSELVLFDINRASVLAPMLTRSATGFADTLRSTDTRRYRLTLITNTRSDTLSASERSYAPGALIATERPIGLAFPQSVYSLSHVALPFPMDDALYGLEPQSTPDVGIHLGTIALHGERGALVIGADQLLRLNCNPFYPYLERRMAEGF